MGRPVHCYVYDLTQGMARTLSRAILGQEIEGVWHASLVVGGLEYFYGYGIQRAPAGRTPFGNPVKVVDLGETEVPDAMIQDLLRDLTPRYRPQDYSFLWHNCTHFADELSLLLTGNQVPAYLTGQGTMVLEHPFLRNMLPMFERMETVTGSATANGFGGAASAPFADPFTSPSPQPTVAKPLERALAGPSSTQAAAVPSADEGAARSTAPMLDPTAPATQAAAVPPAAAPPASTADGTASSTQAAAASPPAAPPASTANGTANSVSTSAHAAGAGASLGAPMTGATAVAGPTAATAAGDATADGAQTQHSGAQEGLPQPVTALAHDLPPMSAAGAAAAARAAAGDAANKAVHGSVPNGAPENGN